MVVAVQPTGTPVPEETRFVAMLVTETKSYCTCTRTNIIFYVRVTYTDGTSTDTYVLVLNGEESIVLVPVLSSGLEMTHGCIILPYKY
jgi:hypothetical protein